MMLLLSLVVPLIGLASLQTINPRWFVTAFSVLCVAIAVTTAYAVITWAFLGEGRMRIVVALVCISLILVEPIRELIVAGPNAMFFQVLMSEYLGPILVAFLAMVTPLIYLRRRGYRFVGFQREDFLPGVKDREPTFAPGEHPLDRPAT
jgi:hypothetical protein